VRSASPQTFDAVIVGGGVIGLACAWRLSGDGAAVAVVERGRLGGGTSAVAAGMLSPIGEVEEHVGSAPALRLALAALARWPRFGKELEEQTGVPLGMRWEGTLLVARDGDQARELERQRRFRERLGLAVHSLSGRQARLREPELAPAVRGALELGGEGSVEPRRVLAALEKGLRERGVALLEGAAVERLLWEGEKVVGVGLGDGRELLGKAVVVATGAWTGSQGWLSPVAVPVRPVRGELLILAAEGERPPISVNLRCGSLYLVPRLEGQVVVGATMEERGFASRPRAGAVYDLLKEGGELVPALHELALSEVLVGFRPATPDNLPLVGPAGPPGLYLATGHFRNGILQAPLCAELVWGWLAGGRAEPQLAELCLPARFSGPAGSAAVAATVGV
jgi:glycine oxidase